MTTVDFDAPADSSDELEYQDDEDSDEEYFIEFKDYMLVNKECQTDFKKKAKKKQKVAEVPIVNNRFEVP